MLSNDAVRENGTRIGAHNFKTKYNILMKKFLFLCKDQMILSYVIFSDEIRGEEFFK